MSLTKWENNNSQYTEQLKNEVEHIIYNTSSLKDVSSIDKWLIKQGYTFDKVSSHIHWHGADFEILLKDNRHILVVSVSSNYDIEYGLKN